MREYDVAVAQGCTSKTWKNRRMSWSAFVDWQRDPRRTPETVAEYRAMTKARKAEVKNGPCYVAGYLDGGSRRKGCCLRRSMVVLDADTADADLWDDYCLLVGARAIMYPTHSSAPTALKFRLVIPLSRDVSAEEYTPLAIKLAEIIGAKRFDPTTFQPERLMYKSSCSSDARFDLTQLQGDLLDPDEYLGMYEDWHDVSSWGLIDGREVGRRRSQAKAGDPREKKGVIGAFCRAWGVEEAIAEFLGDAYASCGPHRYTYRGGSTFGGAVVYDDLWLYSNHATDPAANGHAFNAFDLVRVHRFGELDSDTDEGAREARTPSFKAMSEWAASLPEVSLEMSRAAVASAQEDFGEMVAEEVDDSWMVDLTKDLRTGMIAATAGNLELIFAHDVGLAGRVRYDVGSDTICAVGDDLPWRAIKGGASAWRDADDAGLRIYLECKYAIVNKGKIDDAVTNTAEANPFDPMGEYIEGLPEWDGTPRVDTLLVDLLGAEDTAYTRAVTRKTLCAAIRRARHPGCKFDTMLILEGRQGIGKSTIFAKLAGRWFTDSLSLSDIDQPKVAGEKIKGNWICEVAELDGMAKASIERLKSFLSTSEDNYRAAYARRAGKYPRRCIVVGTVNNLDGYLRDATGNRRFWPVRVTRELVHEDMTPEFVAQVWAEAKKLEPKERLYLEGDVAKAATEAQREAMETDPREGIVADYLDTEVPEDMRSWSLQEREDWWASQRDFKRDGKAPEEGLKARDEVSIIEVWHEALKQPETRPTRADSYQISAMLRKLGWDPIGSTRKLEAYGTVKVYGRSK